MNMESKDNNILFSTLYHNKISKKFKKTHTLSSNVIPMFNEYNFLLKNNYSLPFLKYICKEYKLKISGNKSELINRIYFFLFHSNFAIKIQKNYRRYLRIKYNKLLGPALFKPSLCTNFTDFLTFEKIEKIRYSNFFSYEGENKKIWGFNIISFYNLFSKSNKDVLNPYTREKIDIINYEKMKKIIKISKILKHSINTKLNNSTQIISGKKKIELKCLEIFQIIENLGNYTDIKWFLSLNKVQLIKFIKELMDIWEYRAQLDLEIKKQICFPYGNPFRFINLINYSQLNIFSLQKSILSVIEQFIKKGTTRDNCNLGASYVLCALTLVNEDAANALPWLYESVA